MHHSTVIKKKDLEVDDEDENEDGGEEVGDVGPRPESGLDCLICSRIWP